MTPAPSVKVTEMTVEEEKLIKKCLIGHTKPFIKMGPRGYMMTGVHRQFVEPIYHMAVRPDDVWVLSYPRSGTTWTQEMVWLIQNNLDYKTAKARPLYERFPMIETTSHIPELGLDLIKADFMSLGKFHGVAAAARSPSWQAVRDAPSPRFVKTHLPLSLLPPALLDTARVVYVARDPRDVAVSLFYFYKMVSKGFLRGNFKDYWNAFRQDLLPYSPIVDHVNEAWEQRLHPNLLLLFYEDMINDLPSQIRRVCDFFNKEYTDAQVTGLAQHLSFDSLKKNKFINTSPTDVVDGKTNGVQFIRNGQSGSWVKHFDEKMVLQAEEFLSSRMKHVDLHYPSVPPYIYETACSYL